MSLIDMIRLFGAIEASNDGLQELDDGLLLENYGFQDDRCRAQSSLPSSQHLVLNQHCGSCEPFLESGETHWEQRVRTGRTPELPRVGASLPS
jgi:hypothetical protein